MNSGGDPADLVGFLVAMTALIAAPEIAQLLGPYMAIFLAASAGAAFSASGNDKHMAPFETVCYVAIRVFLAVVLTVSVAEWAHRYFQSGNLRAWLVPVALAIGSVTDFNKAREWVMGFVTRAIGKKVDGNGN